MEKIAGVVTQRGTLDAILIPEICHCLDPNPNFAADITMAGKCTGGVNAQMANFDSGKAVRVFRRQFEQQKIISEINCRWERNRVNIFFYNCSELIAAIKGKRAPSL